MIKINIRKKLMMADGEKDLVLDAEFQTQSFNALNGPSGAGKTSILRILAGLLEPEEGIIEVNGITWLNTKKNIKLPVQKRSIGFVFQDYALFPNMTVKENLLYALPKEKNQSDMERLMQSMNLSGLENQKPSALSGGQKQRVALIRAIIREPEILLLDEPFSALDTNTRLALQTELQNIHNQYRLTTFMVSHQLSEIYRMANNVVKLDLGQVIDMGEPGKVFGLAEEDSLVLIGEVLRVEVNYLILLIDKQAIKFELPTEDLNQYYSGERVTLSGQLTGAKIQKLS